MRGWGVARGMGSGRCSPPGVLRHTSSPRLTGPQLIPAWLCIPTCSGMSNEDIDAAVNQAKRDLFSMRIKFAKREVGAAARPHRHRECHRVPPGVPRVPIPSRQLPRCAADCLHLRCCVSTSCWLILSAHAHLCREETFDLSIL